MNSREGGGGGGLCLVGVSRNIKVFRKSGYTVDYRITNLYGENSSFCNTVILIWSFVKGAWELFRESPTSMSPQKEEMTVTSDTV